MLESDLLVEFALGEIPSRLLNLFLILGQSEVHGPNLPIIKWWSDGVMEYW
jgi:hypothetical protein